MAQNVGLASGVGLPMADTLQRCPLTCLRRRRQKMVSSTTSEGRLLLTDDALAALAALALLTALQVDFWSLAMSGQKKGVLFSSMTVLRAKNVLFFDRNLKSSPSRKFSSLLPLFRQNFPLPLSLSASNDLSIHNHRPRNNQGDRISAIELLKKIAIVAIGKITFECNCKKVKRTRLCPWKSDSLLIIGWV